MDNTQAMGATTLAAVVLAGVVFATYLFAFWRQCRRDEVRPSLEYLRTFALFFEPFRLAALETRIGVLWLIAVASQYGPSGLSPTPEPDPAALSLGIFQGLVTVLALVIAAILTRLTLMDQAVRDRSDRLDFSLRTAVGGARAPFAGFDWDPGAVVAALKFVTNWSEQHRTPSATPRDAVELLEKTRSDRFWSPGSRAVFETTYFLIRDLTGEQMHQLASAASSIREQALAMASTQAFRDSFLTTFRWPVGLLAATSAAALWFSLVGGQIADSFFRRQLLWVLVGLATWAIIEVLVGFRACLRKPQGLPVAVRAGIHEIERLWSRESAKPGVAAIS